MIGWVGVGWCYMDQINIDLSAVGAGWLVLVGWCYIDQINIYLSAVDIGWLVLYGSNQYRRDQGIPCPKALSVVGCIV